jgi:cell division protein FtsB
MNGNLVPVLIVAIVMFAMVMKARYRYLDKQSSGGPPPQQRIENARLEEEVKALKQRIQTLERITVEKENSLSREIESLRDR